MKFILVAVMLSASLFVEAKTHRIVSIDAYDFSYTGGFSYKKDNTKSGKDRKTTQFRFNLNYAQDINQTQGLMVKGRVYYNREKIEQGVENLSSTYGLAGGLLYNFDFRNVKDSFFVGALVGAEKGRFEVDGGGSKSGINYFISTEGGKRWDLGHYSIVNISYAPTISFDIKRYGGKIRDHYFKTSTELKFNFLKFDILF